MSKDFESVLKKSKRLHFVGIGGISMSTLAALSMSYGYEVSGSDMNRSDLTDRLEKKGARIIIGHSPENAVGADVVVYTAAVFGKGLEEVEAAKNAGSVTVTRGEFLGYLMKQYEMPIGVSGTHGKTTTTGMISHVMIQAELDPSVANGAVTASLGGAYREGGKKFFVYEACEYKDSFLSFFPRIAVITNVELDHTDYFRDIDHIIDSFRKSIAPADIVVYNASSENARAATEGFKGRKIGVSAKNPDADYYAANVTFDGGCGKFDLFKGKNFVCQIALPVIGAFNVENALCASAVCLECGVSPETLSAALSTFKGAKRRFERVGVVSGVAIYDDYAHHPDEVCATLTAAKRLGYDKVYCVFQPHTYSRTKDLLEDFKRSLKIADEVILADIYAARETDTLGVSSKMLAQSIGGKYFDSFEKIATYLAQNAKSNELVITMGAGDVYKIGTLLKDLLSR